MSSTPTPVKIGPFNLGMNNRLPDTELKVPKVGAYLRSAVNVDITAPGTVKRREGYALSLAGADCHSLWASGDNAYVVDGTTLYALSGPVSALTKTAVKSGLRPGTRLSFTEAAGKTVCTGGDFIDTLAGATSRPLSLPLLAAEPTVAVTSGTLVKGRYQVCVCYFDDQYQQSGTTTPLVVEIDEGEGIRIQGLPASFPSGIAGIQVFMSEPNGDILFEAVEVDSPTTSVTIPTLPVLGARCQTLLMKPMPSGSIVRYNNGRFFVAAGSILYYSEPFSTLYDPAKNFIPFPSAVTIVEALTAGLYVCTEDATIYFDGDITTAEATTLLPYGGVPGTGGVYPDKLRAFWMSTRGVCQGDNAGSVVNLQEKAIAINGAEVGASLFREKDGMKQVVASLFAPNVTGAAAYSFMDAEIIRKGTTL